LLGFYRDRLGIPLALTTHGSVREHYEAAIGETHVALLPGRPRLVPSFRVADLAAALAGAEGGGAIRVFGPLELGGGKRVAGLAGPDGFEVRVVEIDG
jgi:hypothetical protein